MLKFSSVLAFVAVFACVVLASFFADAARPRGRALTKDYSYEMFVRDFGHSTRSESEHAMRRPLFYKRRHEAITHNELGKTWTAGINQFSDWTDAELETLRNKNYHAVRKAQKTTPTRIHKVGAATTLPHAIDYRTAVPRILTAVKDQGQCGSCWAHAATETMEAHYALITGELSVLSQQQVASCTPNPDECGGTSTKSGCFGATHQLGYDYVVGAGGITEEWMYPYVSYFGTNFDCKPPAKNQLFAAFSGYVQVNRNDALSTMDALTKGPMSIVVAAVPFLKYDGGVFSGCDYSTNNTILDHGVQMVGYGHDDGLNVNYWTVRNSWSSNWGENGFIRFFRAPDGQSEACGWDNSPAQGIACSGGPHPNDKVPEYICGECGLLYDITYPIPAPLK